MNGFVLPSLQQSSKKQVWTSHVTLPPLPADVTFFGSASLLPSLDKRSRRSELRRLEVKAAALEADAQREQLKSLEKKIRSVICGREHEKRYQMIWKHQKEKARIERETAVTEAKALALQRLTYMRGVSHYKERGHMLHLETVTRNQLMMDEEDEWRHIASLYELDKLTVGRRQTLRAIESAEHIAQEFRMIQDWESRISKMSFYPTGAFHPQTQLVSNRNIGTGFYRGRENLLMDYSVCKNEFGSRVEVLTSERAAFLQLEWQHGAARLMFVDEYNARAVLRELFVYGCCQVRLAALLRIQRWWRMLRVLSWRERSRRELEMCIGDRRKQMTSRDYHNILRRLRQQLKCSTTSRSLEELRGAMSAIERAAEFSHQYLFDYFVYTLMNRAKNLHGTEEHRLCDYMFKKDNGMSVIPQAVSLISVPYRLFVRQQALQPYPFWRELRWTEGSVLFMRQVRLLEEAEARVRSDVLLRQEERCRDTLQLYYAALKAGSWAWRSFYTAILFIEEEETMCRGLLHVKEQTSRDLLLVDMDRELLCRFSSEKHLRQLISDEKQERATLVEGECREYNSLIDGEWRWKNLLRLRKRLRDSCGGKMRWKVACKFGLGQEFASLDTTASVIQRFFVMLRSRACRAKKMALKVNAMLRERQLKTTAEKLLGLLITQHAEAQKEEILAAPTTLVGNGFVRESSKVFIDKAVEQFGAWFDERASEPQEQEYKVILARFLSLHKEFYKRMHIMFAVLRDGRKEIERQAEQEYSRLQRTGDYVAIALHLLVLRETSQRREIEAGTAAERLALCERADVLAALAQCTSAATEN